jgi:hypothetical protein
MLFERSAYEAFGGHAAVKDDLLEDLAFARGMRDKGLRQESAIADGMLTVSMYDTWPAFRTGWKRIYIESCVRNPDRLRAQALQLSVITLFLPALSLLSGLLALPAVVVGGDGIDAGARALAVAAACAAALAWCWRTAVVAVIYRLSGFGPAPALAFPLAGAAIVRILLEGARDLRARVPVRWGGREYVLEPTDR